MPKKYSKNSLSFLLALVSTIYFYWPLNQEISLVNSESDLNNKLIKLNLNLEEEVKEIMDRLLNIPVERHKLCLKNRNKIYLVHIDSNIPEMPFTFKTDDISQINFSKDNDVGAMDINFYYNNNSEKDYVYKRIGDLEGKCIKKLQNYASSTITYHHVSGLELTQELVNNQGKLLKTTRQIIGKSIIDSTDSLLSIKAKMEFFYMTLLTLWGLFFLLIRKFSSKAPF